MPTAFPDEFRRDVVAHARAHDQSMASIAKAFGISESCLARWLQVADREDGLGDRPGGKSPDGTTVRPSTATPAQAASAEQRLKELEKRNQQLEQENLVLRRATAYFARDVLPK